MWGFSPYALLEEGVRTGRDVVSCVLPKVGTNTSAHRVGTTESDQTRHSRACTVGTKGSDQTRHARACTSAESTSLAGPSTSASTKDAGSSTSASSIEGSRDTSIEGSRDTISTTSASTRSSKIFASSTRSCSKDWNPFRWWDGGITDPSSSKDASPSTADSAE